MQTAQINSNRFSKLPVFDSDKALSKYLEDNFVDSLKNWIRLYVKTMVKAEMEEFRKEREDILQFNGCYGRNLVSTFGKVPEIPIPRFRQGVDNLQLKSLDIFSEEKQKMLKVIEEMHMLGISQRKISKLSHDCFGINFSKDSVGKIYKELVENEQVNINSKVLDDNFDYLLIDGIWEKTKGCGWDNNKSVLLCALGIRPDGKRVVVGFQLAESESAENWGTLIKSIKTRGLMGKNLKLIISDDGGGSKVACEQLYPDVPVQNCIVHKMRNVMSKTSKGNKLNVIADVKKIFECTDKKSAVELSQAVVKKYLVTEPRAMESLRFNLESCFTYFTFPKEDWSKIRTTNILEREFREVRRRTKVFDNSFQSAESANMYANSVLNYLNDNYPSKGLHTNA